MNAFNMLDAFIGLAFVFLTLSLVVTSLGESVTQGLQLRGKVLATAVDRLIGAQYSTEFYRQPQIASLQKDAGRKPSYIPDRVFADTFVDMLLGGQLGTLRGNPARFDRALLAGLQATHDKPLATTLQGFWLAANYDVDAFMQRVMTWFNDTADRSSGWFKRKLNRWLMILGLIVAIVFNVDAIQVYQSLSTDKGLRDQFVQQAVAATQADLKNPQAVCAARNIAADQCDVATVAKILAPDVIPLIGWTDKSPFVQQVWAPLFRHASAQEAGEAHSSGAIFASALRAFLGWIMTAVALSLGAPFWFDLLQRLVNLRGSVQPASTASVAVTTDGQAVALTTTSATVASTAVIAVPINFDTFSSFSTGALGFSAINAFWMARFSSLAYGAAAEVKAQLEAWGIEGELVEAGTNTQFIVARSPTAYVLAFRGTEVNQAADILTDLDFKLSISAWANGKPYNVHHGFETEFELAWAKVEETLTAYGVFGGRAPLWITGHSLGGALAVLAAARIVDRNQAQPSAVAYIAGLYTFGQPRVGDPSFADMIAEQLPGRYFRTVNNRDGVPLVPPPLAGVKKLAYAHSGGIVYFNEFGRMILDPPLWYRGLDKVTLNMDKAILQDKLKEFAGDHSVTGYVSLCKSLLG